MRSLTNPPNRTLPLPAVLHPAPSSDANVCLPDGGFGERSSVDPQRGERVGRIVRCLVWALLLLAVAEYAWMARVFIARGAPHVNHVFLFWGWSKFIHVMSPVSGIYDGRVLYGFMRALPGAARVDFPFAYPPSMLLAIWPLALLRPVAALLVWLGVNLALYVWACWQKPWGLWITTGALLAPSTIAAIRAAQTSLLAGALMIGGCRLVEKRPVLAGILFGLLAIKPQYGVLVPVALIASRQWRTVFVAGATVLVTVVASGVPFGWACWTRLPDAMVGLSRLIARHPEIDHLSVTVTSALRMLGAGPDITNAAQFTAATGAAVAIWFCFRRGFGALPAAALMVGAFLVTPYALYYDLPIVSYAVLVFVMDRYRGGERLGGVELGTVGLVLVMPGIMGYFPSQLPWEIPTLAMLFVLIVRRALISPGCAAPPEAPIRAAGEPAEGRMAGYGDTYPAAGAGAWNCGASARSRIPYERTIRTIRHRAPGSAGFGGSVCRHRLSTSPASGSRMASNRSEDSASAGSGAASSTGFGASIRSAVRAGSASVVSPPKGAGAAPGAVSAITAPTRSR